MKRYLLVIVVGLLLISCTDKKGATKALLDSGFHSIQVGGYSFFGGGKDDIYKTKFKAYSPDSSRVVTGVVSSGWFKGSTIRLD